MLLRVNPYIDKFHIGHMCAVRQDTTYHGKAVAIKAADGTWV
jgi:hypothetical protein